jgi:hypothetical protein
VAKTIECNEEGKSEAFATNDAFPYSHLISLEHCSPLLWQRPRDLVVIKVPWVRDQHRHESKGNRILIAMHVIFFPSRPFLLRLALPAKGLSLPSVHHDRSKRESSKRFS